MSGGRYVVRPGRRGGRATPGLRATFCLWRIAMDLWLLSSAQLSESRSVLLSWGPAHTACQARVWSVHASMLHIIPRQ